MRFRRSRYERPFAILVTLAVFLTAGSVRTFAQPVTPAPLGEVIADRDGDLVPDHIGQSFSVAGVATTYPHVARATLYYVIIEDESGALRILTQDVGMLEGIEPGRRVRAHGTLTQRRGTEELMVDQVERAELMAEPTPREVLAAELLSEEHMHRLVRVEGNLLTHVDENNRVRAVLEDRSGAIPVRLPSRLLSAPELAERLERGGEVRIVGISGQADLDGHPYDGGYRLQPRETWDFDWVTSPPYGTIAAWGFFGSLTLLAPVLWWRRRKAEKRARRFERLAADLVASGDALRRSERMYRELFENDLVSHFLTDVSGRVLRCNDPFSRLFGFESAHDVANDPAFRIWVSEEDGRRLLAELEAEGKLEAREIESRSKDGRELNLVLNLVKTLNDNDGAGEIRGSLVDLTERKALECDLAHSQRMEVIGRFAGGVAHDLNNMLTAILGNAELLRTAGLSGRSRNHLEDIQHSAERSARLTGQLLAIARKQMLRPTVFDVNDTLRGMAGMLQRLIDPSIELVMLLDEDVGLVKMDPAQIEQVVLNLGLNARDAMRDGGKLVVRTSGGGVGGGPERPDEAFVLLEVSDNGAGMEPETLERIYEPFYTTKESGTGLGLASVYGIVEQCRGRIDVESKLGEGTTVRVRFPCTQEASVSKDASQEPRTSSAATTGTVLVVEDEPAVRSYLCQVLQSVGFTVTEAANGQEALQIFKKDPGAFDLLITDLVMPLMGGQELIERVFAIRPDVPVVITSGYTDEAGAREAISASGRVFLQKPFRPQELLATLGVALVRSETSGSPTSARMN